MIQQLISSGARLAVLGSFLLNADQRFYVREVAARTNQPMRAVQRELTRLEAIGLLEHTVDGNRKYYQVNRNCPIFPELKSIFLKTVALGDVLRQYLAKAEKTIDVAFIYGSYAKGEETTASDVDLFVIGSITPAQLSTPLASARRALGRVINPITMTSGEFRRKAEGKDHFVSAVLRDPKVFLVGDAADLEALAGRRQAERT